MARLLRRLTAALLLASAPAIAGAWTLTIDLRNVVGVVADYTALRVGLRSEGTGSGEPIANDPRQGFQAYRRLTPDAAGAITTDIPASSEWSRPQRYILVVQADEYPFVMPARDTTFSAAYGAAPVPAGSGGVPDDGSVTEAKLAGALAAKIEASAVGATLSQAGRIVSIRDHAGTRTDAAAIPASTVEDEGAPQGTVGEVERFDCVGPGITCSVTGTEATLTVPASTVEDEGTPQGTVGEVERFDCVGPGITCSVTGTEATLTVAGGPTRAAVDGWIGEHPDVEAGVHVAEALATETTLQAAVAVVVAQRNEWYSVGTASLPAAERGRVLRITVAASGEPTANVLIPRATLAATTACAVGDGLGTCGVEFSNPPDNNAYHVGRTTAGGFIFLSDTADTYTVAIFDGRLDVTDHLPECATSAPLLSRASGTWECSATTRYLRVEDEGLEVASDISVLDFVGAGVTATQTVNDQVTVTIPGVSGQLATQSEAIGGTNATALMTPLRTKEAIDHNAVPVVSEVPEDPYLNERIILDAEDDFPGDYVGYDNEALSTPTSVRYDLPGAPVNGPQYVECYAVEYGTSAADIARRGKCYVVTGGVYTMPADAQLLLYRTGGTRTWREISDTAPVSGLTHWFEVAGLLFADVSDTGFTYRRNFRSGLSGQTWSYLLYLDATLAPGDYTYAGFGVGTRGWIGTPGTCAPWACRGDTDRIPRAKLPREGFLPLIDGAGIGESITNSSQDKFLSNLTGFSPSFDLDDTLNGAAILEVVGTFTLSGRSADSIGFNSGSTVQNAQLSVDFSGLVRSSAVAASATYDGGASRGVKVEGTAKTVYNGSASLGEVAVYIGHDSGNLAGYVVGYDASSGSLHFAVGVSLTIVVQHSDIGPAATTFVELTDTASSAGSDGQVPTWRSGALVNEAPAAGGDSYTSHTSLSTLPTSGMSVGDLHVVTEGSGVSAMVTRFVAVSATQLKCVGGISTDLVNLDFGTPAGGGTGQDVSVPTAERWHRLPDGSGGFIRWDFRFSNFLVVTGGINNVSGPWFNDRTWKVIDGEAVRGVTAGTSGGVSAAAQSVEIFTWYGNASSSWKRVRFGRQADGSNAPFILVAIDDVGKQVFPLRIRGSCG